MHILIDVFRFIAIGQMILFIFLLIKTPNKRLYIWSTVFFGVCVIAYLLAYWQPIADKTILFLSILPFSIAVPLGFWMFSKSIFDDTFAWRSSLSPFNKAFKQITGSTPSSYRKEHRTE